MGCRTEGGRKRRERIRFWCIFLQPSFTTKDLEHAMAKDAVLTLVCYTQEGWPSEVPDTLKPQWSSGVELFWVWLNWVCWLIDPCFEATWTAIASLWAWDFHALAMNSFWPKLDRDASYEHAYLNHTLFQLELWDWPMQHTLVQGAVTGMYSSPESGSRKSVSSTLLQASLSIWPSSISSLSWFSEAILLGIIISRTTSNKDD